MTRTEIEAEISYLIEERLGILSQGGPVTAEMIRIAGTEANKKRIEYACQNREAAKIHGRMRK